MPFTTSARSSHTVATVLLRQNRVRAVAAAFATCVLLAWQPATSRVALLAGLVGVMAYVGVIVSTTFWLSRHRRASLALMSMHGITDVGFLFSFAYAISGTVAPSWALLVAVIPLQVALAQFGVRPGVLVIAATLLAQLALVALGSAVGATNPTLPVTELWALGGYTVLASASLLSHRRAERRLRVLASLFDEAREGDFRRAYDVAGDVDADGITDVGAAFNELRAELSPMVNADPATGCLNRRGFGIQLDRALAEARRRRGEVSLLAIDLDHFKQINDRFGHLVGDGVLYEVATMLADAVSEEGVVARMGGEEFTVLLPWADAEAAGAVAERMMTRLRSRPSAVLPPGTPITMSIGIASERITDSDIGSALRARADEALYAAKRSGRNRVLLWAPGVRSNATPSTSHAAIVRRSGEVQRPRYRTPVDPPPLAI